MDEELQIAIACPHCGKQSMQNFAGLKGKDGFPCPTCGGLVDLRTEQNRVTLKNLAKISWAIDRADKGGR